MDLGASKSVVLTPLTHTTSGVHLSPGHSGGHRTTNARTVLPILPRIAEETPANGSYVVDIGASLTRVGVVGEYSLRVVEKTPSKVAEVLLSGRDPHLIEEICRPFLEGFVIKGSGMQNSTKPCVLLMNSVGNPEFYQVVRSLLVKHSSSAIHSHHHHILATRDETHSTAGSGAVNTTAGSASTPGASGSTGPSTDTSLAIAHINDPVGLLINTQVATLWSAGAVTGFVIDIGFTSTRCVPVIRGTPVLSGQTSSKIGAKHLFANARSRTLKAFPQLAKAQLSPFLDAEMIEEIFFQYGCVAPPPPRHAHQDESGATNTDDDSVKVMEAERYRQECLHMSYPAFVKTLTVGVQPNLSLESLFTEIDGEDSGLSPIPLLLKESVVKLQDELPLLEKLFNSVLVVRGGLADVTNFDQRVALEVLRMAKNKTFVYNRKDKDGKLISEPIENKLEDKEAKMSFGHGRVLTPYSAIPEDSPAQKLLLSLKMPESRAPYGGSVCATMGAMMRYRTK